MRPMIKQCLFTRIIFLGNRNYHSMYQFSILAHLQKKLTKLLFANQFPRELLSLWKLLARDEGGKISEDFFNIAPSWWKRTKLLFARVSSTKLIYSERATKFCKISTLLFSYVVPVKSKVDILQNFVAFSESMNFKRMSKVFLKNFRFLKWFNHKIISFTTK